MALWLVRCGPNGEGEGVVLNDQVVGIGWPEAGDLSSVGSPEGIRERLESSYPNDKPATISNWVGQVHAFRSRIQRGDLVAVPLKSSPAVAFGRVTGDYRYEPEAPDAVRHQRSVSWLREDLPRVAIPQDLLLSLGAVMTVCRIQRNDAEMRIFALLNGGQATVEPGPLENADEENAATEVDLARLGRDQIGKRIAARFNRHEMARLVREILLAEGFVCDPLYAGPDGGVDILAGEGGMGFDGENIAVQVKSGGTPVDAPTLRELQGAMRNFNATKGLLVSWAGFTKAARAEARRLFFQIRLWDSDDVIDKVVGVYDRLPADIRSELPLQQVWTLAPGDTV